MAFAWTLFFNEYDMYPIWFGFNLLQIFLYCDHYFSRSVEMGGYLGIIDTDIPDLAHVCGILSVLKFQSSYILILIESLTK